MYRIAVLAEQEAERQRYAEQITRFCEAKGLFPQVMQYDDQERFFETAQHLCSLCPACRLFPDEAGFRRSIPARTECLD